MYLSSFQTSNLISHTHEPGHPLTDEGLGERMSNDLLDQLETSVTWYPTIENCGIPESFLGREQDRL